jgi:hypothetical protein
MKRHAIGSRTVPQWTVADKETHPWQVTSRRDWGGHFVSITADRLQVTSGGILIFTTDEEVCLVVRPEDYSHVRLAGWTGLSPAGGMPAIGEAPWRP